MKTFKEFILEKRSHEEQNPKVSVYEELIPFKDDENVFIHLTDIERLGIVPLSGYKTPLGIYCYPLKDVWDEYKFDKVKSISRLPFAANRKFVQIFKWNGKGKFIDVNEYTTEMFEEDRSKLYSWATGRTNYLEDLKTIFDLQDEIKDLAKSNKKLSDRDIKSIVNDVNYAADGLEEIDSNDYYLTNILTKDNYYNQYIKYNELINVIAPFYKAIQSAKSNQPISKFFNTCRWVSNNLKNPGQSLLGSKRVTTTIPERKEDISKRHNKSVKRSKEIFSDIPKASKKFNTKFKSQISFETNDLTKNWNTILRKLGYAGFSDRTGKGIIHPAEPIQAFFTSKEFVTVIKTVINKDYKQKINPVGRFTKVNNANDLNNVFGFFEKTASFSHLLQLTRYHKSDEDLGITFTKAFKVYDLIKFVSNMDLKKYLNYFDINGDEVLTGFYLTKPILTDYDIKTFKELLKDLYVKSPEDILKYTRVYLDPKQIKTLTRNLDIIFKE